LDIDIAAPYVLVQTRHGPMLANRHDRFIGQALMQYGEYSEIEAEFLQRWIDRPSVVVEVGANIGTHTLPLAKRAAAVGGELVAFEPQPFVFQNLCANLALNGMENVRAWPWACGAEAGTLYFPQPNYSQPGNFGAVSMRADATAGMVSVPCARLDTLLGDSDVSLIKMDLEGGELAALQGGLQTLRRCRPVLYLENDQVARSRALIEWLWAEEYLLWWHICPLFNPENFRGERANAYPNIYSFNMLALPRESNAAVPPGCKAIIDAGAHPLHRA